MGAVVPATVAPDGPCRANVLQCTFIFNFARSDRNASNAEVTSTKHLSRSPLPLGGGGSVHSARKRTTTSKKHQNLGNSWSNTSDCPATPNYTKEPPTEGYMPPS